MLVLFDIQTEEYRIRTPLWQFFTWDDTCRTFCLAHLQPLRLISGNLTDNVYAFGVGSTRGKGSERGGRVRLYLPEAVHGVVSTRTFIVGARHFPERDEALERLKLSSAVGLGT